MSRTPSETEQIVKLRHDVMGQIAPILDSVAEDTIGPGDAYDTIKGILGATLAQHANILRAADRERALAKEEGRRFKYGR